MRSWGYRLIAALSRAAVLSAVCWGAACSSGSHFPPPIEEWFRNGQFQSQFQPRPSQAGVQILHHGDLRVVLEIRRNEQGVEARRLRASTVTGDTAWTFEEGQGERLTDFTFHPSGDISLGVERRLDERDTYDLIRLNGSGEILARQVLARPIQFPAFRMKGVQEGSTLRGWLPWLQLEARGEDLLAAVLSYAELPNGELRDASVLSAIMSLQWREGRFVEEWASWVDGDHGLISVAWQFDEFLWLDAATRLLLTVDEQGRVAVGRTLSNPRCLSLNKQFGELSPVRCRQIASVNVAHRYQPFAVTTFSPSGVRERTWLVAPEEMEEFVVFDMAVKNDNIALVGTAVRMEGDSPRYYFEPPDDTAGTPLAPYDGYLAVMDRATGNLTHQSFIDFGRAEYLASVRWTSSGWLAAGAADWNRWNGGMSVSRGAVPLWVLDLGDGKEVLSRQIETPNKARHTHVLSVDVGPKGVEGVGPSDAPMTHSGDDGNGSQTTFGGAWMTLSSFP